MNPVIDKFGNKRYYSKDGKLHRTDGPALIRPDGSQYWYQNGLLHRIDGPAVILPHGYQSWYQNGTFIKKKFSTSIKVNFLVEGF